MSHRIGIDPSSIGPSVLDPFVKTTTKRSKFSVRAPQQRELDHVDGVLGGAAEADITPPPGMPKAGYSANAHDGAGFRTRLRARVTHLRSERSSIAVVQLDLLAGSSVLQYLVAEAIKDRTDIPLAGLWIGATHTHAGPGQFLGTDFYNHHASNRAGFDPAFTDFLVRQISAAVIEAYENRVPVKVAVGSTEVWGLTRNRSLDPHTHNSSVTDKRLDPQRKWVAVNPNLYLVRVDRIVGDKTEPLSAVTIFSIHGTGVPQKAHEYNADVWGYLVAELSHQIEEQTGVRAVVGASQGTHADVAPALRPGLAGHREARRVGRGVGGEAAALYETLGAHLESEIHLDCGLREVDLDRKANRTARGVEIPDRPAVGAALVAGATENLTPVIHRIPPFSAGHPRRWGRPGPHGAKWILGGRLGQPLVLRKKQFPRRLSVQALRISDALFVGLPFEITVESGRRMAAAVEADLADKAEVENVVICSLVNEYWGYVATEEEYGRQFYEGGHTLYGPNTQKYLAAQAAITAHATIGQGVFSDVEDREWNLRSKRYLAKAPTGALPERRFDRRASFQDPTAKDDAVWEQEWIDVSPGGLHWHEPLVRVERSDDNGETWEPASNGWRGADDQGWSLEISHIGPADGATNREGPHRYRVRWHDPDHKFGRRHRFVLLENAGRPEVLGEPFD
ncbi:MAG: neutral/alkaline non-lysosomal ceramidase N-terminal domain-containing protein [Acidimicrobiales bacterium]|nr:neutral/alkaline non-lysosomal ceramidase N-terminal domain-containing protein [Acidimicrobiales bacterium]